MELEQEKINYFIKKTDKDIHDIAQQATAKKFIHAIYKTCFNEQNKLDKFIIELKKCNDRLTFQNIVIDYFKLVDLEKYLYRNGLDEFYVLTCEEEWIDYRGHFLYLLTTLDLK